MGILDYFYSPESKRAEDVRTGAVAPDRSERKRCWEARDGFYACLDKHEVINSLAGEGKTIAESKCAKENTNFEQNCASAWVTYFKKFRVSDYQKKKMYEKLEKEGANPIASQGPGDTPSAKR